MAAMLSSELGNAEKITHFVGECEAMGLKVLGPDVNESREMFTPVGEKIRFGLAGVKGVGELAAQKIIAEREVAGPFTSFDNFMNRVDGRAINKRVLEHLVKTGAFDFSGAPRKRLFEGIDAAMSAVAAHARDKAAGQHSFMDMMLEEPPTKYANAASAPGSENLKSQISNSSSVADPIPNRKSQIENSTEDFSSVDRLAFEKELLGFYVSGHPMNLYAGLADALDPFPVDALMQQPDRTEFRLCGIASGITKKLSKKDNRPWAAFTIATRKASAALNLFADAYAAYGSTLAENALVLVQGNVLAGNDGPRLNIKECYPLDAKVAELVRKVTWLVHPVHPELPAFLRLMRDTLNAQPGSTRVEFAFVFENRAAPIAEASNALGWKLNAPTFQQLRAHPAVAGVQIETKRLELKQERRWAKRG